MFGRKNSVKTVPINKCSFFTGFHRKLNFFAFKLSSFTASDITYRSLRYLSVDDINSSIRSIGHRAEFREKLFTWRRKRVSYIDS